MEATVILVLVGLVLMSPLGALWRNPVADVVRALSEFIATPFVAVGRLMVWLRGGLAEGWDAAKLGDVQGEALAGGPSRAWAGWLIGAALIDLLFLTVLAFADWAVAAVALAGLLGLTDYRITVFGVDAVELLAQVGGLLFVIAGGYFVAILLEMLVKLPIDHAWHRLTDTPRRLFIAFIGFMIFVSFLTAVLFGFWRELRLSGTFPELRLLVEYGFWVCFALIVVSSSALATAAVIFGWRGLLLLGMLVFRLVFTILLAAAVAVRLLIDNLQRLLIAIIDVVIWPGLQLWNWSTGFEWAERARLRPVQLTPYRAVGNSILTPLTLPVQSFGPPAPQPPPTEVTAGSTP
jgi:hypothetical protein